jgi:uncharacterized membrane protein YedE/YeeE
MEKKGSHWKVLLYPSLAALIVITAIAVWSQLWILTAIPIGFLFGFFLQKGDLCGSSAFSEVLMMKDRRKVAGIWVLIVVAMIGFAVLDLLGWVKLNPKPFIYWNYILGGLVFGVGMVLAGGCVSGCVYKAATGNLNSIVALLMIPVGVMLVEFGPLNSLQNMMKSRSFPAPNGEALSLNALTGIPFWVWALVFFIATAMIGLRKLKYKKATPVKSIADSGFERIVTRSWKPWQAGVAIGLLMIPAYLSSAASGRNYPLGVTHGVMQAELLVIDTNLNHVYQPPSTANTGNQPGSPSAPAGKKIVWWLVFLVFSMMIGSWSSARMSGQAKLLRKPPDEILFALLGGLMVGAGAAFATGCVVGNIMSGWALLSIGTFLFGIVVILANWATTYLYMMGGRINR